MEWAFSAMDVREGEKSVFPAIEIDNPTVVCVFCEAESKAEAQLKAKLWHALQSSRLVLDDYSGHTYCGNTCNCSQWIKDCKQEIRAVIKKHITHQE